MKIEHLNNQIIQTVTEQFKYTIIQPVAEQFDK